VHSRAARARLSAICLTADAPFPLQDARSTVDPLDQYLRQADPALAAAAMQPPLSGGAAQRSYSPVPPRAGSPTGSVASSFAGSMADSQMGSVMNSVLGKPHSPRQRKPASPRIMGESGGAGYEISEDEQKLLAAIQVLEAAMQAVDKGSTPDGRASSGSRGGMASPSPLPGSRGGKRTSSREGGWAGSLTKAAVKMGLAPESWASGGDMDNIVVELNTDPRLAEDFAAECKVFYSKANDGRAQRAAMLADGVALAVCRGMAKNLPFAVAQEWGCRALEILAISSDHTHKVAAAGGIKTVVAGMNAHVINEAVQEAGCAALRNLTVNSDNQDCLLFADLDCA